MYKVDHLKLDKNSPLKKFYERRGNKLFHITKEIRMEWSKIIQALDDHGFKSKNEYQEHIIEYCDKAYRNKLKSGIINILSVLSKICRSIDNNISFDSVYSFCNCGCSNNEKNDLDANNNEIDHHCIINEIIKDVFEGFLKSLIGIKKSISVGYYNIFNTFKTEKRTDIEGYIEIIFSCSGEESNIEKQKIMKLNIMKDHSEISCIKNEVAFIPSIKSKFENLLKDKESSTVLSIIKGYQYIYTKPGNNEIEKFDEHNKWLYFFNQGRLDSIQQKHSCLIRFAEFLYPSKNNKI